MRQEETIATEAIQDSERAAQHASAARGRAPRVVIRSLDVFLVLYLVESLAFLALVRTQPEVARQFARLAHSSALPETAAPSVETYRPELDPAIGKAAPEWRLYTLDGRAVRRGALLGRRVAMLFIGACSDCVVGQIQEWLEGSMPTGERTVLIVTNDESAGAKWLSTQLGSEVAVLHDPDGRTMRAYNAAWRPRAYLIDQQGILSYCQSNTESIAESARQTKRFLQAATAGAGGHRAL